jgi:WD40 repeat protein
LIDSGRYAITASSDNSIRLTNLVTGDERFRVKDVHRDSYPSAFIVTTSGFIVSCGKNGEVRLFDQTLGRHRGAFWAHSSQINGVEEIPGDAIVTCGDDAKLKF